MSVQRIVEDSPAIELQAEAQHTSGEIETPVSFSIQCIYIFAFGGSMYCMQRYRGIGSILFMFYR